MRFVQFDLDNNLDHWSGIYSENGNEQCKVKGLHTSNSQKGHLNLMVKCAREYLKYPAFIAQRSEEKGYLFPKIRICSNSMHSR